MERASFALRRPPQLFPYCGSHRSRAQPERRGLAAKPRALPARVAPRRSFERCAQLGLRAPAAQVSATLAGSRPRSRRRRRSPMRSASRAIRPQASASVRRAMRRSITLHGRSRKTSERTQTLRSRACVAAPRGRRRVRRASAISSARSTRYVSVAWSARARVGSRSASQPWRKSGWVQQRFTRETIPQRLVVLRRESDAAGERTNVEAGAADDDRALAAAVNIARSHRSRRSHSVPRSSVRGIEKADEMMRDRRRAARRWRRRADRHPAIDLPRVGTDDLGIELARQLDARAPSFRSPSHRRE